MHNINYKVETYLPKDIILDRTLNLEDKGMLFTIINLPNDFNCNVRNLSKILPNGKDSIAKSINRLIKAGYLERYQQKDKTGKFSETILKVNVVRNDIDIAKLKIQLDITKLLLILQDEEYYDWKCPVCKQNHILSVPEIRQHYLVHIKNGEVEG